MRKFQAFTSSVLLMITPTMSVYSAVGGSEIFGQEWQENDAAPKTLMDSIWSYDDFLRLLDKIESGDLEKMSPEELDKITQFLVSVARQGVLPDQSEGSLSLEQDIEELLGGGDFISLRSDLACQYTVAPALLCEEGHIVLCKHRGWFSKQAHQIVKFVKEHKKEIIIGIAVVAGVAMVAGAVAIAGGAAGTAVALLDSDCSSSHQYPGSFSTVDSMDIAQETPMLKTTFDDQVTAFKETLVQNEFFSKEGGQGLSLQENGRILGSLFAHDSYKTVQDQIASHPRLAQEAQEIHLRYGNSMPGWEQGVWYGHPAIDQKFSTDFTHLYTRPGQEVDFTSLAYQMRGEKALEYGYYHQAVQDLGKAIEKNPSDPIPYLERGMAHFSLGQYDQSLEDYHQFTLHDQTPRENPLSISEFSLGFARGIVKGAYESGEGFIRFMGDAVRHPIQTSRQAFDAVSMLVGLMGKDEWGVIAENLFPEVHQLVNEWGSLSSEKRGDLSGYVVGKYGADILMPGALVKVASKSAKGAQELVSVCRNFQIAQETFLLETAAEIGSGAKIEEVVRNGRTMMVLGEDVGLAAREMAELKQAGQLEGTISQTFENISKHSATRESFELFDRAQDFLKPYKEFMPETQCKDLIYKAGIQTFSRPMGIPENFRVRISDKGAGLIYMHPEHTHTSIRVMPGKPHSPFLYQQKPYVIHMKEGKALDKFGNILNSKELPEAHIPYDEFVYRG